MKLRKGASLMVQGTCSGAGKSLIVTGLCRLFADAGVKVAPFKSQNMALNSFITKEGAEIGRAQALQAEAARLEPEADMNPVLLKAQGEKGSQVVLNGKVHSSMTARQYYAFKKQAWAVVEAAYARLRHRYELVLIEGAGSPAEINLKDDEIVNMKVARHTNSPILLVGDIDRGGVFASFFGTVALIEKDAELIKAFVINRFRGDKDILDPGLELIREKTGIPVVGVIPYMNDIGLEEEDGLALNRSRQPSEGKPLRAVVVRLKYLSNFTDFDALSYESDLELVFSSNPHEIENADLLLIPGSKNTVMDLMYLRESGLDLSIKRAAKKGVGVAGICGGYQMLGRKLSDPLGVESSHKEVKGLELLDVETEFKGVKVTAQTEASTSFFEFDGPLQGYEIHTGVTTGETGVFRFKRYPGGEETMDGSAKGSVWGTYLHGIFDNDGFRNALLDKIRREKGLSRPKMRVNYRKMKDKNIDRWAAFMQAHLDMNFIRELLC